MTTICYQLSVCKKCGTLVNLRKVSTQISDVCQNPNRSFPLLLPSVLSEAELTFSVPLAQRRSQTFT